MWASEQQVRFRPTARGLVREAAAIARSAQWSGVAQQVRQCFKNNPGQAQGVGKAMKPDGLQTGAGGASREILL